MMPAMADADDPLDALPTKQLHDLAVHRATTHADIRFFWRLVRTLPAVEAASGELEEADADIQTTVAHIDDLTSSGEGEVAELLRPFYLDYLRQHHVTPPSQG